ncbi:hypothetical protein [Corallococcus terminator]|uniref:Uncharacterized protein n=1 Tax=Corallococcus terminator TaxID=2316733 RepID=A0A3A8JBS5_9BACT|nr:hypothetical protein [Corallococcus terminator]RKG92366.1 hypothetical protein D7V88_06550 [Corallococcus terminator]
MSISLLNRSSLSAPSTSRSNNFTPVTSPAESVKSTQATQPGNDLLRKLMTDSFEQGPSALGGLEKAQGPLSQLLGGLVQLAKALEAQGAGGQGGGDLGLGAQELAPSLGDAEEGMAPAIQGAPAVSDAAPTQGAAPVASKASGAVDAMHSNRTSDAGPGFGAPSAGSTEQVSASEPWLARNNVGSPYNSNMLVIDPSKKGDYKYTNTFANKTNQPQTVTLWNKTGEKGGPNDGQHFDKSTPKTFTLQPGESKVVAFDTNSSVAWCVSKDGSAKPNANSGQTWGEATFANAGTGWSGYDTSQISPAGHNGKMSISNEANGHTVTEANAWQTPSDDPAGRDVGVPAGPLNLNTVFS